MRRDGIMIFLFKCFYWSPGRCSGDLQLCWEETAFCLPWRVGLCSLPLPHANPQPQAPSLTFLSCILCLDLHFHCVPPDGCSGGF